MGRDRYKVVDTRERPYFVTCTVTRWIALFSNPQVAQIILDALQFLHEKERIKNHGYVLMENHLHLLLSAPDLSSEMRNFKSFTGRSIVEKLKDQNRNGELHQLEFHKLKHKNKQRFQVWQEGFHPEQIVDVAMFQQKLEYIHNNPVRRGYVEEARHWRYSSWSNYMTDQDGLIPVEVVKDF